MECRLAYVKEDPYNDPESAMHGVAYHMMLYYDLPLEAFDCVDLPDHERDLGMSEELHLAKVGTKNIGYWGRDVFNWHGFQGKLENASELWRKLVQLEQDGLADEVEDSKYHKYQNKIVPSYSTYSRTQMAQNILKVSYQSMHYNLGYYLLGGAGKDAPSKESFDRQGDPLLPMSPSDGPDLFLATDVNAARLGKDASFNSPENMFYYVPHEKMNVLRNGGAALTKSIEMGVPITSWPGVGKYHSNNNFDFETHEMMLFGGLSKKNNAYLAYLSDYFW